MRIMQIIPEFCLGGAETMCANLSIELQQLGHEVIVVSLYRFSSPVTELLKKNNVKLIYMDKRTGMNPTLILKLSKLMKKEKPDVVHTHLYSAKYAHIAAVLTGVKGRVHTIHNMADKDGGFAERKVNQILIKYMGVVPVSLSELIRKTVINTYGVQNTPIVFNGVPLQRCLIKREYVSPARKFVHIGRFVEQKNHRMLIEAFSRAHELRTDVELFLYGEGDLLDEIKNLTHDLNADEYIHFCGLTKNPFVTMSEADCFVLPSLWEGIPMTLIEAMGTGLPIIASDVGGIFNMLVNNESALFIKPEVNEIIDAIIKIHDDTALSEMLGKNALKESIRFSANTMAQNYICVYEEVLK